MKPGRWSALVLGAYLLGAIPAAPAVAQEEASRVRILLVLDTLDRMGATWGLDGENMKALFEHAFKKQGLQPGWHYTIDMFTGQQVTAKAVLDYYRHLNVGPNETLVFYYSGHGGFHGKKGHFMALTTGHQQLYRNDILKAMDAKNPRLKVVLTDCCANLSPNSAWQDTEPAGAVVRPTGHAGEPGTPRAARREPPHTIDSRRDFKTRVLQEPPRPKIERRKRPKAKVEEPPSEERPLNTDIASGRKPATRREPEVSFTKYVLLRTPTGAVPIHEVLTKADGKILRQLLFRHKGVVDINGCPKGQVSQGTLDWGGSLFTLAFIHLQAENFGKIDTNHDGFLEWRELWAPWVDLTQRINRGVSAGGYVQTPEAWQLKTAK